MGRSMRAVVVLAGLSLSFLASAPAAKPRSHDTPEQLVQAALEAGLNGKSQRRSELLAEALRQDPDFAPARWHSGFVRIDDKWIHFDDVPQHVAGDVRLAAYVKQREGLIDTSPNHRRLARWCRKNRLVDEARVHWAKVLEFDPQDAEALKALGLRFYEGRLLTQAQIEQTKVAAGRRLAAMRHWQPKLVKWRRAIERGSDQARTEALENLRQLSDPAAIAALEQVFAVDGRSDKIVELNAALIESVGRIPGPESTQVLLRRAVLGELQEVRDLAIAELKKRPLHAYVPQLIAALPGKLNTKFRVHVLPGGMVLHEHEILIEGREANLSLTYTSTVNPVDATSAMFVTPRAAKQKLRDAASIEAQAGAISDQQERSRARIQRVLEQTTGFARVDDPQLWQRQYTEYQGLSNTASQKPTYNRNVSRTESYFRIPRHTRFGCSCFPAGTEILTVHGPRPIETIQPGDKVLTQNVKTGELSYKPVQATTLRSPAPTVKVSTAAEDVVATTGHPFWVVGQGWKMAKHLRVGDELYSIRGPEEVIAAKEALPTEAYNLVVSESHNYFAGATQFLVHDNSPTLEISPGVFGLAPTTSSHGGL